MQGVIIGIPSAQQSSPPAPASTAAGMSIPALNDSIINRKADPAQGLFQTCLTLLERLRDVPDFQTFLDVAAEEPGLNDPVQLLWRCFRMGSSLCVLFNATRPVELIREERLAPRLNTLNDCKAATFHFLKGIKEELDIDGDDSFMIYHLYSEDTNGFVKVTKTVMKILDILRDRKLLLNRGASDMAVVQTPQGPLDSRARIIQELVETERKYVQDLENLQDYMRYLDKEEAVTKDLMHGLFLNLNQLVDFQRRFLIKVETLNSSPPEQQNWGSLFTGKENSDAFGVYALYAANFEAAQALAVEHRDQLMKYPHPVFDNFAAFLIKPVQRLTKYPLLLRDLIKHTDALQAEDQGLPQGLEAIEAIAQQINEAIRKSENVQVVHDLFGRVEDWKGHRRDQFGELLLHGQFLVIKGDQKGDAEREYLIYLFENILLCCKETGTGKKQGKTIMGKSSRAALGPKQKTKLQLKGRIFMQNVTDVVSSSGHGSYTLQIYWRGDPGVENFVIKHTNEENLNQWKKHVQRQQQIAESAILDKPRGRGSGTGSTGGKDKASEFLWMENAKKAGDHHEVLDPRYRDTETEEEYFGSASSHNTWGSNTTLARSRSGTNENLPTPSQSYSRLPHGPSYHPSQSPPLSVNTNPALYNLATSPGNQDSYFSPVETPHSSRTNSNGSAYPFPRYQSSNGYDAPQFTPPNMSRSSSREGSSLQPQYQAYQARQPMQRPSLPGMHNSAAAAAAASRGRSASTPNITHITNSSTLPRGSPGGIIPPVPTLPTTYIPYSPSTSTISPSNRTSSGSPTSPNLPPHLLPARATTAPAQVKVKIHYLTDKLAIIVPYHIPYAQLLDRIERKVRICGNGPEIDRNTVIRIRYQDEDGDFISMQSDDDVVMAFDAGEGAGGGGAVTLYVQLVQQ
ncbi:hypothetical protein EX30DRAFT_311449 [Ascodesmis nigricans]|uniref:DH domain-containing protein n=1 Tax=Ascodesmis nigricans TaxID=341454 RepID=A0A4V3SHR7_9PEZI|nr:hypothetical protein EX30DRAFT_311449 [Ascodesmis nigricans]